MNWGRNIVKESKRIVVKVGTSTLTYDNGKINLKRIDKLAMVLADLRNQGKEVVLVSSGAIGVGCSKLNLEERPNTIREKQAVAAVGQCELMHIYSKFFGEYGNVVGQVLLTRDVVEDEHIRNNVINTFETLLEKGVIPIVNENDTVSIDEIENICNFGDNDNLSAIVAKLIKGDLLIILSDIDGFYDSDPRHNEDSRMIKEIYEVNKELEEFAGGAGSSQGTGGMKTKLAAAKVALGAGVNMILTNGKDPEILFDILEGQDVGTLFIIKRGLINE
ncbi:glutamate 5-kinase [Clostridium intestinale]|uniref:Glutamate 5-kinase n=1 Tax=Clostridium intestinale DSM 6191 TaxID=1121320 RepID=A0A1M5ZC52_9CLOT|nr:glutamate 5-kinase [Clostridium intestinale]SHI21800.1 glutamate 5-kinase [Clostridium intestinale DSM 6191]